MSYKITLTVAPAKLLKGLRDEALKVRLFKGLRSLETNPRPLGSRKLQGTDELYRVRIGDYRILYRIQDALLVVLVVQIGHRREIYRH